MDVKIVSPVTDSVQIASSPNIQTHYASLQVYYLDCFYYYNYGVGGHMGGKVVEKDKYWHWFLSKLIKMKEWEEIIMIMMTIPHTHYDSAAWSNLAHGPL